MQVDFKNPILNNLKCTSASQCLDSEGTFLGVKKYKRKIETFGFRVTCVI